MKKTKTKKDVKKIQSKELVKVPDKSVYDSTVLSDLVLKGDLKQFTAEQKVKYYVETCKSLGLNPLTKPFDLISLKDGKGNEIEIMYPNKGCAEQLRKMNKISIVEMKKERVDSVYEVTVTGKDETGRYEIATGSVSIVYPDKQKGFDGIWKDHPKAGQLYQRDEYANARMKAETKAKRRLTFALSGLGMLDESEFETIHYPEAQLVDESEKKRREAEEKFYSLPEDIKKGFEIIGYQIRTAYQFCSDRNWNNEKILSDINKIVDKQESKK